MIRNLNIALQLLLAAAVIYYFYCKVRKYDNHARLPTIMKACGYLSFLPAGNYLWKVVYPMLMAMAQKQQFVIIASGFRMLSWDSPSFWIYFSNMTGTIICGGFGLICLSMTLIKGKDAFKPFFYELWLMICAFIILLSRVLIAAGV